eukprot:IDg5552t1
MPGRHAQIGRGARAPRVVRAPSVEGAAALPPPLRCRRSAAAALLPRCCPLPDVPRANRTRLSGGARAPKTASSEAPICRRKVRKLIYTTSFESRRRARTTGRREAEARGRRGRRILHVSTPSISGSSLHNSTRRHIWRDLRVCSARRDGACQRQLALTGRRRRSGLRKRERRCASRRVSRPTRVHSCASTSPSLALSCTVSARAAAAHFCQHNMCPPLPYCLPQYSPVHALRNREPQNDRDARAQAVTSAPTMGVFLPDNANTCFRHLGFHIESVP